jgi:hypothetical protein
MPSTTALPSATPAAPPSAPPPPPSAGLGAATPLVGASLGGATAADIDDDVPELLGREPVVGLVVAAVETRPADVDAGETGVLAGLCVCSLVGVVLAGLVGWRVGFGLVGLGDGVAAN